MIALSLSVGRTGFLVPASVLRRRGEQFRWSAGRLRRRIGSDDSDDLCRHSFLIGVVTQRDRSRDGRVENTANDTRGRKDSWKVACRINKKIPGIRRANDTLLNVSKRSTAQRCTLRTALRSAYRGLHRCRLRSQAAARRYLALFCFARDAEMPRQGKRSVRCKRVPDQRVVCTARVFA